jgi:hypothetical protein
VEKFCCWQQLEHRQNAHALHATAALEAATSCLQWPHVLPLNVTPSTDGHLCPLSHNMMGNALKEAAT